METSGGIDKDETRIEDDHRFSSHGCQSSQYPGIQRYEKNGKEEQKTQREKEEKRMILSLFLFSDASLSVTDMFY